MSRTFVVGDIHGELDRLKSCFKQVNFNKNEDRLISLGDLCDRGPNSWGVVEELLTIKNFIGVRGNHDDWFKEYLELGRQLVDELAGFWYPQGGKETIESYTANNWANLEKHKQFYTEQLRYHTFNNCLFVHAGIEFGKKMTSQNDHFLYWDRNFVLEVFDPKFTEDKVNTYEDFQEIFIGHTPCGKLPKNHSNVWNLDTGCGKKGILTMMNLETKEFVQA